MAPKSRRARPARQQKSDPANLPALSADLWEHTFSFMLRIHRLPTLCVCKTWREAGLADANLWRFLVVTDVNVNAAEMAPQRRLPQVHGEYTPSRAVLEGALPISLRQLSGLPQPSFVREIIFARDWAALPEIKEDEVWFEKMEELLEKLPALPQLRKLRVPLFFLHTPAMAALATWMRVLPALEFLDLPIDDDEEGLVLWTETWRSGVLEPNSRLRSRKVKWEWADDLPKLFPNLRGISRLWAHHISPTIVKKWPADFRAQIEVPTLSLLALTSRPYLPPLPLAFPTAITYRHHLALASPSPLQGARAAAGRAARLAGLGALDTQGSLPLALSAARLVARV